MEKWYNVINYMLVNIVIHWGNIMVRRKNIALFVAMIENEISYAICEGALLAAKEMDANLFIMPAGIIGASYDDVEANSYRYQYNTLFSYAQFKDFDAVVMEYGAVTSCMEEDKKIELLKHMGDTPTVLIAGEVEGYSSICIHNRSGMESAVHHLIREQNCKKIGYVSGPVETSQDARERLEAYRIAMQENHLPVEDDWIVYGNFSEFSEEVVTDLLTRHADMDAIVFANDHMAMGGYRAMRKMGIEPGKDIMVTGFDDSPIATSLNPRLTSVRTDTKEIAYRAVLSCDDLMEGKEVHELVDSHLIVRESSNRESALKNTLGYVDEVDALFAVSPEELKKQIYDKYLKIYFETSESSHMKQLFETYFAYFIDSVDEEGKLNLDEKEFVAQYNDFSLIYLNGYADLDQFFKITNYMHMYLNRLIKSEEDRMILQHAMMAGNHALMNVITRQKMVESETNKDFEIALSCVTRDMLQFSKEEKKKYETVITKLQKMNFASGYLYTYGRGIEHESDAWWCAPEWTYVKAYHDGEDVHLYKGKEKRVKTSALFANALLPQNRRFDMLVLPMFSGEEQYGLLMAETRLEHFLYASQIASQVSVSIEVLEIIKKQNAIKKELEKNLAETVANNRVLDEMSRSDHLTGVLNRRGFLNTTRRVLEDEQNYGKKAIAIYADMDNLKIINDEFGHDEGDYSLKTIAKALTESFRQSDVVARMGGDEFAAFAIVNQDNFPDTIRKRIHSVLEGMNEQNDKLYRIAMSVGIVEFVIGEDSDIERILSEADMDLYAEKKNKRKQVYK